MPTLDALGHVDVDVLSEPLLLGLEGAVVEFAAGPCGGLSRARCRRIDATQEERSHDGQQERGAETTW